MFKLEKYLMIPLLSSLFILQQIVGINNFNIQ